MKPGLNLDTVGVLHATVLADQTIYLGMEQLRGAVVFSTPAMIDLMEHAAREVLRPYLDANEESVGANVHIEHLAATPIGANVRAEARVTAIEVKLIDFDLAAFDEVDQIGRGTHRRAIIQTDRFASRLAEKTAKLSQGVALPMHIEPNTGDLARLEALLVERDTAVVTVTLNRPQKLNAVNRQMTSDWERVNAWLAGHPEVRVVLVTGAGEAFCAGDDVPEVGTLSIDEATAYICDVTCEKALLGSAWRKKNY